MTAVKANFDGERIEVPEQLRKAPPREVIILFDESPPPHPASSSAGSIWDVIGRGRPGLTREECDAIIREERESWGER